MASIGIFLAIALLCGSPTRAQSGNSNGSATSSATPPAKPSETQDSKTSDPDTTKLKIIVINSDDKPAGNASVYLRFNQAGGFLHKDKLAEMSFKTNEDGSVKVPNVPIGKVLIQVVGKGLHTYGKWYDITKDQEPIEIKLERLTHWY